MGMCDGEIYQNSFMHIISWARFIAYNCFALNIIP